MSSESRSFCKFDLAQHESFQGLESGRLMNRIQARDSRVLFLL